MGNDADEPLSARQLLQNADGAHPAFLIQRAEALVDEHGVDLYIARRALDHIRHPQRHGQGGEEGFAAGKGFHIPDLSRRHAVHIQIQPHLALLSKGVQAAAL